MRARLLASPNTNSHLGKIHPIFLPTSLCTTRPTHPALTQCCRLAWWLHDGNMIHGPIYVLRHILCAVCNTVCLKPCRRCCLLTSCLRSRSCNVYTHFYDYFDLSFLYFFLLCIRYSVALFWATVHFFYFITITMIVTMNTTKSKKYAAHRLPFAILN